MNDIKAIEALVDAITRSAILRTESVTIQAPVARAILALATRSAKFSEPQVSEFPISVSSFVTSEAYVKDHYEGLHTYSAFCILCTAS